MAQQEFNFSELSLKAGPQPGRGITLEPPSLCLFEELCCWGQQHKVPDHECEHTVRGRQQPEVQPVRRAVFDPPAGTAPLCSPSPPASRRPT